MISLGQGFRFLLISRSIQSDGTRQQWRFRLAAMGFVSEDDLRCESKDVSVDEFLPDLEDRLQMGLHRDGAQWNLPADTVDDRRFVWVLVSA